MVCAVEGRPKRAFPAALRRVRILTESAQASGRRLAVVQPPPTQYVDRDGVSIAYQVVGDGPVDLLMSPGNVSHLDLQWTEPGISRFLARLASFSRLII